MREQSGKLAGLVGIGGGLKAFTAEQSLTGKGSLRLFYQMSQSWRATCQFPIYPYGITLVLRRGNKKVTLVKEDSRKSVLVMKSCRLLRGRWCFCCRWEEEQVVRGGF